MSDNLPVTPGTGAVIAADEIGGALHQRIKVTLGVDGSNDGDVSSSNPMPVIDSASSSIGSAIPVSGTLMAGEDPSGNLRPFKVDASGNLLVDMATPSGLATAANQSTMISDLAAIETSVGSIDTKTPSLGQAIAAASVPVVLPLSQISALSPLSSVTVTQSTGSNLHVAVDSLPSLPTGSNAIGSVSVSNFPITQPVSGTVSVSGSVAVTGPLTDTQLRATAVPVSVSSLPLPSGAATETTLSALNTKIPSSLTVTSTRLLVDGSGVTQPVSVSALPLPTGASTSALQTTGNSSLSSIDGKTPALGQALAAASVPVVLTAAQLTTLTPLSSVSVSNFPASQAVTGTFFQATQPVSASSLPLPTGAATSAKQPALGTAGTASSDVITVQGIASMTALKVDGSAVTQPVSGTVAVSGSVAVTGPLTDTQLRATAVPVSGTFFQATQPVSAASLPLPTGAATETTLSALNTKIPASLTVTSTRLLVDGSGVTQPVSIASPVAVTGTFFQSTQPVSIASSVSVTGPLTDTQLRASAVPVSAASLPLPTGAATSALQTTGNSSLATIVTNTSGLAQGSTTSGQVGGLEMGAVTTAAPTYTTGQTSPLSLTTAGALRVDSSIADGYLASIATNTGANATDFTAIGTITALNGTVSITGQGTYTTTISITGTWSATLIAEAQAADNNWYQIPFYVINTSTPWSQGTTISSNGFFAVVGGGYLNIRIRASAYTSGTVNVAMDSSLAQQSTYSFQAGNWTSAVTQATASNLNAQVVGNVASGATDSGNPVKAGGVYNSTPPTLTNGQRGDLQLDANGNLCVTQLQMAGSGTITGTQNVAAMIHGHHSMGIEISGSWTGTLLFEGLVGSTWNPIDVFDVSTELIYSSTTANATVIVVSVGGLAQVRVRGATVSSGTATISTMMNNGNFSYPFYARAVGDPIGSYGIQVGGVDPTTNTYTFQHVNTLGAAGVYLESSNKAAYKATIIPVTPPATPTDIVTLYGSATKTIRITKVTLGSTQNTAGINDWYLIKRSAANTGGTSTTITPVPLDSLFPAATAVFRRYTANPTALGAAVGNLSIENILSPQINPGTSGTSYVPHTWDFTNNPLVLRGVSEGVAINFNGAALPAGLSVNLIITWTEE